MPVLRCHASAWAEKSAQRSIERLNSDRLLRLAVINFTVAVEIVYGAYCYFNKFGGVGRGTLEEWLQVGDTLIRVCGLLGVL